MNGEEIAAKLASHEQRIVGAEHRIKDLEETQKQIQELTMSVQELAISVKSMVEEQKRHSQRLRDLEAEPGEKWKKTTGTMLTTTISEIVKVIITVVTAVLVASNYL